MIINQQNLHIVGCVGCWQEGATAKYTIDNLLKYCDEIAILLDKPNVETEQLVRTYEKNFPGVFHIEYSTVPPLRDPRHIRRRTKVYASELGEQKLAIVKKIHESRSVDILLAVDSDEVFNNSFVDILTQFWSSKFTSVCMRPMDVYDTPYFLHNKGMASHWRIYKYSPFIHYTPWRYRDFFHPYRERETWKGIIGGFVHLNMLRENMARKVKIGNPSLLETCPDTKLWKIDKPAWELTIEEYQEIINKPETCLLKDYEKFSSR
jgi:hypothetical protein